MELASTGAKRCLLCRPHRDPNEELLAQIDARYRGFTLKLLQPLPDLNTAPDNQERVISVMKLRPFDSFYFCGRNDVGKTLFLSVLCENAIRAGRFVFISTLTDWVKTCQDAIKTGANISIAEFQQSDRPYSIFIDDLDKARPTEYVAELLFHLIDAVYRHKHQLVVTTQLDPEERTVTSTGAERLSLLEHFERADPRYGEAIVRRMVHDETSVWRLY